MKKRPADQEPWMAADDYGRSLKPGLGVNLLVKNIAASLAFAEQVLGATPTYADEDFAVVCAAGSEWMLHADHTYLDNPMTGIIKDVDARGAGIELRLYGLDPDTAEQTARDGGWTVLAGAMDKPHGMREAFLIDDDGYVWVPSKALQMSR